MGLFRDFYEPDPDDYFKEADTKTCRHCGATGLWWFPERRGRYFLKNPDGTQHNCQRVPASADEFEDCATSTTQPADGTAVER